MDTEPENVHRQAQEKLRYQRDQGALGDRTERINCELLELRDGLDKLADKLDPVLRAESPTSALMATTAEPESQMALLLNNTADRLVALVHTVRELTERVDL